MRLHLDESSAVFRCSHLTFTHALLLVLSLLHSPHGAVVLRLARWGSQAHADKIGAVFVHYEPDTGTWIMKVDGF